MRKLVIFNLRTDPTSSVLGASMDWIEAFREHFNVTDVVSTHVGKSAHLEGIQILEIGGGSIGARFVALKRLFNFAFHLILNKRDYFVFHHMSPRTAVFPGVLFKIFGIPQGLWYSHSSKPLALRLSSYIVDWVFSSETNSLPLRVQNSHFVGHGISLNRFDASQLITKRERAVLFVGRISQIKNLTYLINELASLSEMIPITLIGPQSDKSYVKELRALASKLGVSLTIKDPISYDEVNSIMKKFKYFYSGMNNSVDKSALEAAISGCLVLTTDLGTQELSGMKKVWDITASREILSIQNQIKALESLGEKDLITFQELVRNESTRQNSLEKTISKISSIMKESK